MKIYLNLCNLNFECKSKYSILNRLPVVELTLKFVNKYLKI